MDWHRLFGLVLTDFFSQSPFVVELEKDLSLKQELLDVVIVRKLPGDFAGQLPDGFENLGDHNLITFKSYQEALDSWTMKELLGHYVNYRKQVSLGTQLLPETSFRLYGVCARFPTHLASEIGLETLRPGVLQCRWGTDVVRIIVLRDLPRAGHNAPLHLFSAVREQVEYAQGHYRKRSADTSSLVEQLLVRYQAEGIVMPYTMEDFRREVKQRVLRELTAEDRLALFHNVTAQEIEELLRNLPPEKRRELLRNLPLEEADELIRDLPTKRRLEGLSRKEIDEYLKQLEDTEGNGDRAK